MVVSKEVAELAVLGLFLGLRGRDWPVKNCGKVVVGGGMGPRSFIGV